MYISIQGRSDVDNILKTSCDTNSSASAVLLLRFYFECLSQANMTRYSGKPNELRGISSFKNGQLTINNYHHVCHKF